MSARPDVIIIGGGIVGAACAYTLSREKLKVKVIEENIVAGGATGSGMGHIVVMDDNPAEYALTLYSQRLWNELAPQLPASVEVDPCGTLWVATDDEEMAEVWRKHASYVSRGVVAEVLDAKGLAAAEPNLRPGLAGGLQVRSDSVIYAPCAAQWFLDQSRAEIEYRSVNSVDELDAGMIVVAAGVDSHRLFPQLDVRPRKGHLAITDRYPGYVRHQLVELGYLKSAHGHSSESVAFNIQPRKTGQFLIGSSRQYGTTSREIDQPLLNKMLRRAVEYLPSLLDLKVIRTWTGFRPSTPDNMPAIGPHPEKKHVYFATGHEGLGITTSLGTAHLIADMLTGRTSAIDVSPFGVERLWRQA